MSLKVQGVEGLGVWGLGFRVQGGLQGVSGVAIRLTNAAAGFGVRGFGSRASGF